MKKSLEEYKLKDYGFKKEDRVKVDGFDMHISDELAFGGKEGTISAVSKDGIGCIILLDGEKEHRSFYSKDLEKI